MLEAGGPIHGRGDHGSFFTNGVKQLYRHLVSHRQEVQKSHPTYWATNPDFFVDDVDNPYSTPPDKPFRWIRSRRVGGRSLVWDAVTPRFSDFDFKAASRDGFGPDWPLTHADLAPHYAELERFLGVHGSREGLPQLPDGEFRDPRPMTPAERVFKERVERVFPERRVIISRGLFAGRPRIRARRTRASRAPRPRSGQPGRPAGSPCEATPPWPGCWWTGTAGAPPGWSSWTPSPARPTVRGRRWSSSAPPRWRACGSS